MKPTTKRSAPLACAAALAVSLSSARGRAQEPVAAPASQDAGPVAAPEARPETPGAAPNTESWRDPEETFLTDDPTRPALPYHAGARVPRGFRLDTSPRYGLVAAGVTTMGSLWTASFIAAIALDKEQGSNGDPNFDDMYWPMFIPVLGPFITIGTADSSGTGAGILALDGALQAGGLAMLITGLVAPKSELIPQRRVKFTPRAGGGSVGLDVSGSF
ncbi:MAG: hypothetical protein IPM79_21125 [Polyangiaceae bacterium]|jgi:hypothetical protein|nr:hypothetical protein [Polyangiaceae bacterium]